MRSTPGSPTEGELRELHAVASVALTGRDFVDNPELADAVRRAVAGLGGAERVKAAKDAVAAHFDREMDQISRFYRRQSRKILAPLAVLTVLVFQANAVALALDLWSDSNLRAAVVGGALAAARQRRIRQGGGGGPMRGTGHVHHDFDGGVHAGDHGRGHDDDHDDPVVEAKRQLRCAGEILEELSSFHVGLGWSDFKDAHRTDGAPRAELTDVWPYLTERYGLAGRALTAIALLFGAQFWFDILRRLVGLRKPAASSSA